MLPTGVVRRTSRLVGLPVRHAARTAAAASRLSRATAEEVATRGVEQAFATLGELRGGAVKLGQAFSLFEAAMPAEVAGPYRSALTRLSEATPAMPAAVAANQPPVKRPQVAAAHERSAEADRALLGRGPLRVVRPDQYP